MPNSIRILLYVIGIIGFASILVMDLLKIIQIKSTEKKIENISWTMLSLATILIIFSGSITLMFIMLIAEVIGFSIIRHYKKLAQY